MGIMSGVFQVIAKVLLDLLPIYLDAKFLSQPLFQWSFYSPKQALVFWQAEIGLFSPAKVIDGSLSLMWLMDRVFLAKDQYSKYSQFLIEIVIFAEAIEQGIEQPHIATILSNCQFGEFHWPEGPAFYQFQKLMMHQYSMMVVVHQSLRSPFLAIVSMACHAGLEESHQASVPLVDVSSDIDVSLHIAGVIGDEIGAEDAAQ